MTKNLRKPVTMLLALCMVFSLAVGACADDITASGEIKLSCQGRAILLSEGHMALLGKTSRHSPKHLQSRIDKLHTL